MHRPDPALYLLLWLLCVMGAIYIVMTAAFYVYLRSIKDPSPLRLALIWPLLMLLGLFEDLM